MPGATEVKVETRTEAEEEWGILAERLEREIDGARRYLASRERLLRAADLDPRAWSPYAVGVAQGQARELRVWIRWLAGQLAGLDGR